MSSLSSIALVAALAVGCSSGEDKAKPAQPETNTPATEAPAPAPANKRKPRGADAYTGEREVKRGELGQAPDGTLLAATDGKEHTLSSFYGDSATLVIFYRGHW